MNIRTKFVVAAVGIGLAVAPAGAVAGTGGKTGCDKSKKAKTCQSHRSGRMTGGGSIFGENAFRTTHGFQIRCGAPDQSNLEVNWDSGNRFHATSFYNLVCSGPPTTKPAAGFNTLDGQADGTYNGQPGATATFTFTDLSEPGTSDTATIRVFDAAGNQVLFVSGTLEKGNHQAHGG